MIQSSVWIINDLAKYAAQLFDILVVTVINTSEP